jgi:superfamily II DNA or RNA helicase
VFWALIVHIAREVFGKGNDFAKKITYRVSAIDPETLIAQFRNQYNPRIAVSVDMIATGTDIKPVEVLIFLRDVKSVLYFEQMKRRGVRTINPTDLTNATPDDLREFGGTSVRARPTAMAPGAHCDLASVQTPLKGSHQIGAGPCAH